MFWQWNPTCVLEKHEEASLVQHGWLSADSVRRYTKSATLSILVARLLEVVQASVNGVTSRISFLVASSQDDNGHSSLHRERATAPHTWMAARSNSAATKECNAIVQFAAGWPVAKELQQIGVQVLSLSHRRTRTRLFERQGSSLYACQHACTRVDRKVSSSHASVNQQGLTLRAVVSGRESTVAVMRRLLTYLATRQETAPTTTHRSLRYMSGSQWFRESGRILSRVLHGILTHVRSGRKSNRAETQPI